MKRYLLLSLSCIIVVSGGLLMLNCNSYKVGPTVVVNPLKFKKQYPFGRLTDSYQGKSDYIVVLIPNVHNSFECQAEVYKTQERLLLRTRFIAREWVGFNSDRMIGVYHWGFVGPFYFRTKPGSNTRTVLGHVEKFVKFPKEKRVAMVNRWIKNNQFPEGSTIDWPIKAPYLIEAVYQDEVKCVGVGDKETNMRAAIAVSRYQQGMISFETFANEVLEPRNKSFVKNIQNVIERENSFERIISNYLVPFSVGLYHIPGLKKLLREDNVSYVVIQNSACVLPKRVIK